MMNGLRTLSGLSRVRVVCEEEPLDEVIVRRMRENGWVIRRASLRKTEMVFPAGGPFDRAIIRRPGPQLILSLARAGS